MDLDERLRELLRLVVEAYIASGEPVGSQSLVKEKKLDMSPATVRNWLAELEAAGFLTHAHTSGGRLPTELGYQQYVMLFVRETHLRKRDQLALERANEKIKPTELRFKALAKTLAELSGEAVVVGLSGADTYYTGLSQLFAQPEFKNWQRVVSLSEVLDQLDETLQGLRRKLYPVPRVFLGRECPFGNACGAVMVSDERGLIGILGPLRMDYAYMFTLLCEAWRLLKDGEIKKLRSRITHT